MEKIVKELDPRLKQTIDNHTTYAIQQLMIKHPELRGIPSEQLTMVFVTGVKVGADIMRQASAADLAAVEQFMRDIGDQMP